MAPTVKEGRVRHGQRERAHARGTTALVVAMLVAATVAAVAVVVQPLRETAQLLAGMPAGDTARAGLATATWRLWGVLPAVVLAGALAGARVRPRRDVTAPAGPGDPLTGTATRAVLHDRLEHAVAASGRHGGTVAVLRLDLDGFSRLDGAVPHDVGDRALIEVANRLRAVGRRTDLVARLGGDEFVVVAEHLDGESGAGVVADKVLAAVRDPFVVDEHTIELTASLGVALCPRDSDDGEELLALAGGALVTAKQSGGDTYRFSTVDLRVEHEQRRATLAELRSAVHDDQLELAYQPQIDLRTGEVVCAEALLRWRPGHGTGLVPAGVFIALTENTELAEQIGGWALDTAIQQVREWQTQPATADLAVAVNIGLRHVRSGNLLEDVRTALDRHGVAARHLEVEVAEPALAADPGRVAEAMRGLHALGVRVVLDAFGTGQTSLALLPELPLHAIKLDATLGNRLAGTGAGMVAGLVGLGRELGLQVILPRIEHAGQLRRARQLGCHRAQGDLIAPPQPAHRVIAATSASIISPG